MIEIYCKIWIVYFLQTVDEDNTFMFLKSYLYMGGGDNKYYF